MPDITYTLGGTSFDAVPETLTNKNELPVRTESTIARTKIHSVGLIAETIVLTGKYMTAAVKDAIALMLAACEGTGATVVLDDGYSQRNVLISEFETTPIVGQTDGFSFRMKLVAVGGAL